MAGGKAGVTGGVVLAAGIGFARFGDDCARGGAHGARALDDVAVGGTRMAAWGPEGVAGAGLDDAARLGLRVDGAAVPGLRGMALHEGVAGSRASEGPWFEAVRDFGIDVGVEVMKADLDGEPPAVVATPGQVRCPNLVDMVREPEAWDRLLGGLGVACAPVVVVGTANEGGTALQVGEDAVPLRELAAACVDVEARCVLVGCPADAAVACAEDSARSLTGNRLQPSLPAYVRGFVERALAQDVAPVVVAELVLVDGEATLVLARPRARRN